MSQETRNYIFYLQLKPELDNSYIIISELLNKVNIRLIPIMSNELKIVDKEKKQHIIVFRSDLSAQFAFLELKKVYLERAIVTGKVAVYDISSFSELEFFSHLENKLIEKDTYRYFQLPLNLKQVAMSIAVDFFRDRNKSNEWPGGRRAKLPAMTN